jgi:hypothetical protein
VQSYETEQVQRIDFSGAKVTVNPVTGSAVNYDGTVT